MGVLRPPLYDSKPIFHRGTGVAWVGYGMFMEWPSACFMIVEFYDEDNPRPAGPDDDDPEFDLPPEPRP